MNTAALIVPLLIGLSPLFGTATNAEADDPVCEAPQPVQPLADYNYGDECNECDFNIENGLKCTIPAKKTCGRGEMSRGSGYCVAQPTDSKGYCSSTCKKAADCPDGYSCVDLKTGAGGVCVQ